jgi:hypothetical protein
MNVMTYSRHHGDVLGIEMACTAIGRERGVLLDRSFFWGGSDARSRRVGKPSRRDWWLSVPGPTIGPL